MKTRDVAPPIVAALLLLAGGGPHAAQEAPAPITDESILAEVQRGKEYTFVFLKTGDADSPPEGEVRKLQMAHLHHLFELKLEGLATLAGPFLESGDLRGLVVFNTTDHALVRARLDRDPYVQAGLMRYEIVRWFGIPGSGIR